MKTKKEIIEILKTMFPGKYPYMYETVANLILSDQDNFKPIDEAKIKPESELDPSNFNNNKKQCTGGRTISAPNFDGSKDVSLQRGFCSTVINYDEDVSYKEDLHSMFNNRVYYDPNTNEYARAINDICYEIFNKYISIGTIWNVLDANRQISVDKLNNALDVNVKPLDDSQEKILHDAVDALSPLADEYCPWCSWMFILRELIKILDRRKKDVPN